MTPLFLLCRQGLGLGDATYGATMFNQGNDLNGNYLSTRKMLCDYFQGALIVGVPINWHQDDIISDQIITVSRIRERVFPPIRH